MRVAPRQWVGRDSGVRDDVGQLSLRILKLGDLLRNRAEAICDVHQRAAGDRGRVNDVRRADGDEIKFGVKCAEDNFGQSYRAENSQADCPSPVDRLRQLIT